MSSLRNSVVKQNTRNASERFTKDLLFLEVYTLHVSDFDSCIHTFGIVKS